MEIRWMVVAAVLAVAAACPVMAAETVVVHADQSLVNSFMGLGIQWDPYSYPPTPEEWKLTLRRLDYCRPAFFRVMGSASYCLGFDKDGAPRYVWDQGAAATREKLGPLFDILDYCQKHDITVMLGEWSWPKFLKSDDGRDIAGPDDPRWARIIADFVQYLRTQRHYTCIRLYNMFNEPNGSWMWKVNYDAWATGIRNLRKELDSHGLQQVAICGPDNSGNWEWLDRAAAGLAPQIGAWEMHWYAWDKEVVGGQIEALLSQKREMLLRVDPNAASKPRFMGESGIFEGRVNGDQQPRVKTFVYGVLMADYAAQVARAGWMGLSAWDLDDAMHTVKERVVPPTDLTLKVWGFWNTQGRAMGHPEDENIRPWFYTWSLMCRLFPRGCQILQTDIPDGPGFRATAMRIRNGRKWDLSFMLVNDEDRARTVVLKDPGIVGRTSLTQYSYFDNDRPVDANGIPVPARSLPGANLAAGLVVTLPTRGVVFLTTMGGGQPATTSAAEPTGP